MAHFAEIINGVVERVIVADTKEWCEANLGGTWVQTSYNTYGGDHTLGGTPLRANYAGIGYTYDAEADVFYAPQPFASWILNTTSYLWEAPVAYPEDGNAYTWNEETTSWELIPTE